MARGWSACIISERRPATEKLRSWCTRHTRLRGPNRPSSAGGSGTERRYTRARGQPLIPQDLAAERELFSRSRVAHAPMWDHGWAQSPRRWSAAVHFAVHAIDQDPESRVFVHCQQGRRRSVLVAYAVLRVLGRSAPEAASLISTHRAEAQLVPAYQTSVEEWLAAGAPEGGRGEG